MICYSIPYIFLLDDDPNILKTITYYIDKEFNNKFNTVCYSKINELYEYFNTLNSTYINITDIYNDFTRSNLTVNQTFDYLKYFAPIFIIDHNLGEDNLGSEICQYIKKNYPLAKVVLLTGEVSYDDANDMHNKKHIDFFMRKDNHNVLSKIREILNDIAIERERKFNIDGEIDVSHNLDILYKTIYTKKLGLLINNPDYNSHIILNSNGDVAVNSLDGFITVYTYSHTEGKFIKDESNNNKYYG